MWLRVLGLPTGVDRWWRVVNPPAGSTEIPWAVVDDLLCRRFPGFRFSRSPLSDGQGGPEPVVTVRARPDTGPAIESITRPRDRGPDVLVVTEDGPDAGRLVPLSRSGITVGRNDATWRISDPYLSSPHFRLTMEPEGVRITPLTTESRHPARSDSWWHGQRPHLAGSSEFRLTRGRPEPVPPAGQVPDLVVDPGPAPTRPNPVVQAVMAAGPLVIGIVMAVVTGYWFFLLFSLVSVAVMVVLWSQHRSATRRHLRRLHARARDAGVRVDTLAPSPGRLSLAARSGSADRFGTAVDTEWSRDGPILRWGRGNTSLPLSTQTDRGTGSRCPAVEMPVVSVLRPGRSTVVSADPSTLETVAQWLRVQLYRDAVATGRPVLLRTRQGDHPGGGGREDRAGTVLCWPGTTDQEVPEGWHRVLMVEAGLPTTSSDRTDTTAPADLLEPEVGHARIGGLRFTDVRCHGMSEATADWLVDEISETDHPTRSTGQTGLTFPTPLFAASATDTLSVPLSADDDGLDLDLVAHGPHLLVAGTTGSGKSELLLTLLTGLAAAHPATEVSFILMDFKGGSSFAALSPLPHTMSVETNLAEAESLRTLDALAAELRRRERLFLQAGVADFLAYRSAHAHSDLPRLVVAVDELRVLVDDHPTAAAVLARLAATGRSLGFHLVLATQRAQGAVGPDIRSNLGTVICLRTATEQESWDLLGSNDAFRIPADAPGRAFVKHGGQPPRPFQAGRYTIATGPPELVPRSHGGSRPEPTAWPELTARIRAEAESQGHRVPRPVVTPPLPESWFPTPTDRSALHGAVVVGLVDLPEQRTQVPAAWRPGEDPPTAWIGTPAGGVDEAARNVLASLPLRESECTIVLDGAGVVPDTRAREASTAPVDGDVRGIPDHWLVVTVDRSTPDALGGVLDRLRTALTSAAPVTLVVTQWGRWAAQRVGSGYETVEEALTPLVRDHGPGRLSVALFGGRELAGGRILGQVPVRYYLPAGTTPEHRMVWPTLRRVREVPGRAVLVSPDHPAPGVAVHLAAPPPWPGPSRSPGPLVPSEQSDLGAQSAEGVSTTGTEA